MPSINNDMDALGLVSRRARRRLLLEPDLVEAALARLDRPLTHDEQVIVLRAVADRGKIAWPDWWEVH